MSVSSARFYANQLYAAPLAVHVGLVRIVRDSWATIIMALWLPA